MIRMSGGFRILIEPLMQRALSEHHEPMNTILRQFACKLTGPRMRKHTLWLLGGLVGAAGLTSCGTRHNLLDSRTWGGGRPTDYDMVATSDAMASSVPEVFDNGPAIKGKALELIEQARPWGPTRAAPLAPA